MRSRLSGLLDEKVAGIFGHDFGASVAAYCALIRPDVFLRVAAVRLRTARISARYRWASPYIFGECDIATDLAALARPRKHYHHYYCTRAANNEMHHCLQGSTTFSAGTFMARARIGQEQSASPCRVGADIAVMPPITSWTRWRRRHDLHAVFRRDCRL